MCMRLISPTSALSEFLVMANVTPWPFLNVSGWLEIQVSAMPSSYGCGILWVVSATARSPARRWSSGASSSVNGRSVRRFVFMVGIWLINFNFHAEVRSKHPFWLPVHLYFMLDYTHIYAKSTLQVHGFYAPFANSRTTRESTFNTCVPFDNSTSGRGQWVCPRTVKTGGPVSKILRTSGQPLKPDSG